MSAEALTELIKQQQQQITGLLEAMRQMPGMNAPVKVQVQQQAAAPADIRAERLQRLAVAMRKSNRVREFKHNKDSDIRKYIKKFDAELLTLKSMVGITDDLARGEYIPLFSPLYPI